MKESRMEDGSMVWVEGTMKKIQEWRGGREITVRIGHNKKRIPFWWTQEAVKSGGKRKRDKKGGDVKGDKGGGNVQHKEYGENVNEKAKLKWISKKYKKRKQSEK